MGGARPAADGIDALFIGYEDQENLGLRSIIATLDSRGFRTALEPYRAGDPGAALAAIERGTPRLVGFSVIFQYTLDEVAELTGRLREAGVRSHFTVGGHFPSLRPKETLNALPHVDSVVRFEGELTAVELLRSLDEQHRWSSIQGLAFREEGSRAVTVTTPRPLIRDLDSLPPPYRDTPGYLSRGVRVASVLASRGCVHDCAFCSIRRFYGEPPGPLRRTRTAGAVVREMRDVVDDDENFVFIFQDDDFANKATSQRRWIGEFLDELTRSGLRDRIRWKISCRVDDVDAETMSRCQDHGLVAVYLGVESGSATGLRTLNKQVSVEQNLRAIQILKELDLAFDMGFMLFEPESTFSTVRENIGFLRQTTSDGSCPANFCKMLPYAGTPAEERLRAEQRLRGTLSRPDYRFRDRRLDWLALFVAQAFHFRNFDSLGLVSRLRTALFDEILAREFEPSIDTQEYRSELVTLTADLNRVTLDTLERAVGFIEGRSLEDLAPDWGLLGYLSELYQNDEIRLQERLDAILSRCAPDLLDAFVEVAHAREGRPEPSAYAVAVEVL